MPGDQLSLFDNAGADAPRTGFETAIKVESSTPHVAVWALDAAGTTLGASKTVETLTGS